jgi:hypothetical protein
MVGVPLAIFCCDASFFDALFPREPESPKSQPALAIAERAARVVGKD